MTKAESVSRATATPDQYVQLQDYLKDGGEVLIDHILEGREMCSQMSTLSKLLRQQIGITMGWQNLLTMVSVDGSGELSGLVQEEKQLGGDRKVRAIKIMATLYVSCEDHSGGNNKGDGFEIGFNVNR